MRFVICIAIFVLVAMASGTPLTSEDAKPHYNPNDAPELFEKFIKKYNRNYKDEADKKVHYEAFVKTLERINRLNSNPKGTAVFDINHFADYTEEELEQIRGLKLPNQ